MIINIKNVMIILLACTFSVTACANNSSASAEGPNIWSQYVNAQNSADRPFVDFSSAGFNYGEVGTPDTSGWKKIKVSDHGATANDGKDDTAAIQAAVKAAQKAAKKGGAVAVQFADGKYLLNSDPSHGPIFIRGSRIVLRGSDSGQTVFHMANAMPPREAGKKWTGPAMIIFRPSNTKAASSKFIKKGPKSFEIKKSANIGDISIAVDNSKFFRPGEYVQLQMQSPKANAYFLKDKPVRSLWSRVNEKGVALREIHRIKEVRRGMLVFDSPLLSPIDIEFPWNLRKVNLLQSVGFENICVDGNFQEEFAHHKNAAHDSGHRAVELSFTAHSWVKNSCFHNVSNAVSIKNGMANSVLLNRIEGNSGHYAFQSEFSTRSLIGLNMDNSIDGQFHGPSASHFSVGTVIWRYNSANGKGVDLHGTFPRHTLFDKVTMAGLGNWGGNYKDLPNHLGGLVFWNFHQTTDRVGNRFKGVLDFWQLPKKETQSYGFLTAVDPVIVGYRGSVTQVNEDNARVESLGSAVLPESLYEAQLERRMGGRPAWMNRALRQWQIMQAEFQPKPKI